MPYEPIQGQGQGYGDLKVAKMADFKVDLLLQYACNQKSNGELWYSNTMSKFLTGQISDIRPRLASRDLQT